MEISIETFEAMLVLLFKIGEHEACEALLDVYKRIREADTHIKKSELYLVQDIK